VVSYNKPFLCSTGLTNCFEGNDIIYSTVYEDPACTTKTREISVQLNECTPNGGTTYEYNAYVIPVACGVSDPLSDYPPDMPAEMYSAIV
jgi:hypothetical protein